MVDVPWSDDDAPLGIETSMQRFSEALAASDRPVLTSASSRSVPVPESCDPEQVALGEEPLTLPLVTLTAKALASVEFETEVDAV